MKFMEQLPWSETITAIVAGIIGWVTSGRFAKQSVEVQNAQSVLQMWRETSETQRSEISELKSELKALMLRIDSLENHIQQLELENQKLKIELDKCAKS
jgi:peptidoglycan hydrolase CwlO-like protein